MLRIDLGLKLVALDHDVDKLGLVGLLVLEFLELVLHPRQDLLNRSVSLHYKNIFIIIIVKANLFLSNY